MKSEKGKTKSEKVRTSILFTFSLLLFTSAATAETVEYWDPVGKVTNSVEAVVVTADTATLAGGWYVVRGEVSRTTQINVTGTDEAPANLILADGAKLTVDLTRNDSRVDHLAALHVPTGKALSIWATRENGTGAIEAKGRYQGAGIGGQANDGSYVEACGTVSIYGGNVTAIGSQYAAGIGGGGRQQSKGGGASSEDCKKSRISIYGGKVVAKGIDGGAAIGGGNRSNGGTITIAGGEVIAENSTDSDGAGIGGGFCGSGGTITITGGRVSATGGTMSGGAAGIGGGGDGAGGDVTISGGTVVAKAGKSSVWDIGSGASGGDTGEFVVTGGSVLLANSGLCRDGYPKNGDGTQVYGVMMAVLEANAAMKIDGLADYGTNDIYTDESGRICLYLPSGSFSFTLTDESQICSVTVVDGQASVVPVRVRTSYWDPVSGVEKSEYCIVVDGSTVLKDGDWYVVTGKVARGSVVVNGKANLILRDGCELKATGGANQAGVSVNAGNSLTIYGQMAGTGKLTAKGGDGGAGIGGIEKVSCGAVTINGGTVTATGGWNAAGIGGGKNGAGGKVMVNGGTVTATGAQWGAGIGGGSQGAGGAVTIINGRLDVKAGEDASVIGAGIWHNSHGTVAISGGIFSWKPNDAWIADPETVSFMSNSDSKTARDYPWAAVKVGARVTFARPLEHMTAAWTSGDGSVTNAISGTSFAVSKGESGVKVIFTPEKRYELDKTEYAFAGPIDEDCTIPAQDLPTASYLYAVVTVGQLNHMTAAWTSGDGTVTNAISGTTFEVLKGSTGVKIIFTPEKRYELDKTEYLFDGAIDEDCSMTAEDLPKATHLVYAVVTVGQLNHMTAAWTSGDDSVTNAISGTTFEVLKGSTGVKIIFTPEKRYELDKTEYAFTGAINENCTIPADALPTATCLSPMVTVGHLNHITAAWTSGDGSVTNLISDASFQVLKDVPFKVMFMPEYMYALEGPSVYESAGISGDLALTGEQVPVARALPVEYFDTDGSVKSCSDYAIVTNATTVLASGWYVVVGKISRGSIAVSGDVKLILADGCELTATGTLNQPGVAVAPGNSLTIYGQTANTGRLTARGGDAGSGIGGGVDCGCGTVTINGGTVTATGGFYGAGIGCGGFARTGNVGFVTINGGRLSVRAGQSASVIGAGYYCEAGPGMTRISGGVFSWRPDEGWLADRVSMGVFLNLDAETRAGYPWAVKYLESVVIFEQPLVGMTAAWTSGDGTKANEICGAFFKVPMGATDAKIVFTPESNYRFVEDGETGIRELPSPLVEDVTITPPRVERITVPTAGPWNVGDAVTAYVSDDGTLVIGGTGAMDDFANAADAPWDPAAVTRVTVADDVTLGKNALAALSDTIRVSANASIGSMRSALGTSTGPSGAISAGFESIEVLDGTAYLGVAVKTNVNLTAEAQDWGKVGLEAKDVSVENGSVIIAVPANTEQGFFYLMSKPAVPSDKGGVPFQPTPRLMSGKW